MKREIRGDLGYLSIISQGYFSSVVQVVVCSLLLNSIVCDSIIPGSIHIHIIL